MTTGKTIALTLQISVGKVKSLLFNMLFRFVKAFFPNRYSSLINALPTNLQLSVYLPRGYPAQREEVVPYTEAALSLALDIRVLSHSICAAETKTPQTRGLHTLTSPCSGDWDNKGQQRPCLLRVLCWPFFCCDLKWWEGWGNAPGSFLEGHYSHLPPRAPT